MADVTITTGEDQDDGVYVSVNVEYLASLVAAKQELKRLKTLPDAANYLLEEHPDLVDYSGLTVSQAVDSYPELFDYELYERDC